MVTIWPKNVSKAKENWSLIKGVASNEKYLAIEYNSAESGHRGVLLAEKKNKKVWHGCHAVQKGIPCWHLGAATILIKEWAAPVEVDLTADKMPVLEGLLQDETPNHFGRAGDFLLISGVGEAVEPEIKPDTSHLETLEKEDRWLAEYKLPSKVFKKVMAFRESQKKRLSQTQLAKVPKHEYMASGQEVISAIVSLVAVEWEAPLLIGPKGSGKSTLVETLAAILLLPINRCFGGLDINAEALLGGKTLEPHAGLDPFTVARLKRTAEAAKLDVDHVVNRASEAQLKVVFEPGVLLEAVQNGELIVIDEVNMLLPEVTSLLHGLLDWQKCLAVPGLGTVKAHPSFRMIACMNFGYAGTKSLNEAFQDRFRSIAIPHLKEKTLKALLESKGCGKNEAKNLASLFNVLADRTKNGDISERTLSIRSLFRVFREHQDTGESLKKIALSVLTDGVDDDFERSQVKDVIDACLSK